MQFVDEVVIEVSAGAGGNGCKSFRREKYRPMGGPSGGNGGNGGSIILCADHNLSTLLDLRYQRVYKSDAGEHGRGKDQHGRNGEDREVRVPTGTMIYDDETGELLCDLTDHEQRIVVAEGGSGGWGNRMFTTDTRQAPDYAHPGKPGVKRMLRLELKLLADAGVIGFPNVGKSTLISRVSKAKPKIADYPFTTLTPNLGVCAAPGRNAFVMADVPGLIEGAHTGQGLGIRFLKHIERTRVFLHVLELSEDSDRDPIQDYHTIENELAMYDEQKGSKLAERPTIVAINKVEDPDLAVLCDEEYRSYFEERNLPLFIISAQTGEGLTPLLHALTDLIEEDRKEKAMAKQKKEELGMGVQVNADAEAEVEEKKEWNPLG